MSNQPKTLRTLKNYVDKLGKLKSSIKELEEQVQVLRQEILTSERESIKGNRFTASVITYDATLVSWKSIVQEVNVPQSLIDKHTQIQERSRITLSAR
jgi:hypothetical protein